MMGEDRATHLANRITPEQRRRREEQAKRTAIISAGGPNAPKDGTFGGVKKERA